MNTNIEKDNYFSNFSVDCPDKIRVKTQDFIRKVTDTMSESSFDGIYDLFLETKFMSYSIQGYMDNSNTDDTTKKMLFYSGYNSALIDLLRIYSAKMHTQVEIRNIKTSYRDNLLQTLNKRGSLLHKDLAMELMVSPSGLTAIIKQMNATSVRLINIEKISKFKIYSLTPIGRQYIQSLSPSPTKPMNKTPSGFTADRSRISTSDKRFKIPEIVPEPYIQLNSDWQNKARKSIPENIFQTDIHTFNRPKRKGNKNCHQKFNSSTCLLNIKRA